MVNVFWLMVGAIFYPRKVIRPPYGETCILCEYNEKEYARSIFQHQFDEWYTITRAEAYAGKPLENLYTKIRKKCQNGKTLEEIADELLEDIEEIRPVYELMKRCPNLPIAQICHEIYLKDKKY